MPVSMIWKLLSCYRPKGMRLVLKGNFLCFHIWSLFRRDIRIYKKFCGAIDTGVLGATLFLVRAPLMCHNKLRNWAVLFNNVVRNFYPESILHPASCIPPLEALKNLMSCLCSSLRWHGVRVGVSDTFFMNIFSKIKNYNSPCYGTHTGRIFV